MLKSVFHGFFSLKKNISVFALVLLFCLYEIVGLCKDGTVFVRHWFAEKDIANVKNELLNNEETFRKALEEYDGNIEGFNKQIKDSENEIKHIELLTTSLEREIEKKEESVQSCQQENNNIGKKISNLIDKRRDYISERNNLYYEWCDYPSYRRRRHDELTGMIEKVDLDISNKTKEIENINTKIASKKTQIQNERKQITNLKSQNTKINEKVKNYESLIEKTKCDIAECMTNYENCRMILDRKLEEKEELEKKYRKEFEERLVASRHLPFIIVLFLTIFLIVLFIIRCVYLEDLKKLNQEIKRLLSN